jgi:hypothetical protein
MSARIIVDHSALPYLAALLISLASAFRLPASLLGRMSALMHDQNGRSDALVSNQ